MRSTITVLAWDKGKGEYKTTVVVDHVVRWISIFEVEKNAWGTIAESDRHFFEREEKEGAHTGTGILLSNGEHLILLMPVEDWEQLYKQAFQEIPIKIANTSPCVLCGIYTQYVKINELGFLVHWCPNNLHVGADKNVS